MNRARRLGAWMMILPMLISTLAQGQISSSTERLQYLAARKALSSGAMTLYQTLSAPLKDYILYPYLEIAAAQRAIESISTDQMRALLERHRSVPRVHALRRAWLRHLASQNRWDDFLTDYQPTRSIDLRCMALMARIQHRGEVIALDGEHRDLWLSGSSRPKACDPVFRHWQQQGLISEALYYQRALLAVAAGEPRLARFLTGRLDAERSALIERRIAMRSNPDQQLGAARHWQDTGAHREIVMDALLLMARQRNDQARQHWSTLGPHFAFSDSARHRIERELALFYATDYPADALTVLSALPEAAITQQIREWTVRVAVQQGNWPSVLATLSTFPEPERSRDRWRYWQARALDQTGRTEQAQAIYTELSRQPNYYGFLAADRSGNHYALCPQLRNADPQTLARLLAHPGLQRAFELFHVQQLADARSEWNAATRLMSREDRRHGAILADMEGWYDRATLTLADTGHWQQYQLRFPLAWRELIEAQAAARSLNPSMIYGVMRSESALVTDAVSGADARGLMQLILSTAKRVARKYQLPPPSRRSLTDVDTNITLGSAHLAELFEQQGHHLRVLAAYNAGPAALDKWDGMALPVEADRWIETVPYHETREYLTRVLAFATLYDWRREGRMIPLRTRMSNLDQRPGVTDAGVEGSMVPICPNPA